MNNSIKINKFVDEKELAEFLRDLADAIEKKDSNELVCVDDLDKIKINVRNEFGQIKLKAKIKPIGPCDEDMPADNAADGSAVPAKPDYTTLKKRMKSSFRTLVKVIHDGKMPPEEAVTSFLKDSALMITYPGYGDEYYESYIRACETFRIAHESGDVTRMHEAIDALVHEKGRCHAKYD